MLTAPSADVIFYWAGSKRLYWVGLLLSEFVTDNPYRHMCTVYGQPRLPSDMHFSTRRSSADGHGLVTGGLPVSGSSRLALLATRYSVDVWTQRSKVTEV